VSDSNLQDWVGKTEQVIDYSYPTPVKALAQTLDDKTFVAETGQILPELWHWLYFLPLVAISEIGEDGHPKRGGFLPPVSLERRMWASSRLEFHQDLLVGEQITKTSEIAKITEKEGKAGKMVFVTVKHSIKSVRGVAVLEEQDIVYLPMPKSFAPPAPNPAPTDLLWKELYPISPVLLFRFSALTFNSHKIHYDLKYATEVEKYPGLVVHGPLQALLLLESARKHHPGRKVACYEFKAVRPILGFDQIHLCGRQLADGSNELFTANADNNIGMQAHLTWR
jgi:3-methylfumaryl-CoA hydratase